MLLERSTMYVKDRAVSHLVTEMKHFISYCHCTVSLLLVLTVFFGCSLFWR